MFPHAHERVRVIDRCRRVRSTRRGRRRSWPSGARVEGRRARPVRCDRRPAIVICTGHPRNLGGWCCARHAGYGISGVVGIVVDGEHAWAKPGRPTWKPIFQEIRAADDPTMAWVCLAGLRLHGREVATSRIGRSARQAWPAIRGVGGGSPNFIEDPRRRPSVSCCVRSAREFDRWRSGASSAELSSR